MFSNSRSHHNPLSPTSCLFPIDCTYYSLASTNKNLDGRTAPSRNGSTSPNGTGNEFYSPVDTVSSLGIDCCNEQEHRPSTVPPTPSSQSKFHVGVNLPSYLSMCVYKDALDVISKKPFMVKRKKSQELGTPGALSRDSHPYIFLTEVCKEHDLSAGGSKVELSNCLLNYCFSDPTRVPEYVSRHFPHGE